LANPAKHRARNDENGSRFSNALRQMHDGANRGIRWRTMFFRFLPILVLGVLPAAGRAETPTRYDMAATLATVPLLSGDTIGGNFFFETGNQTVFNVTPKGSSTAAWKFWSTAAGQRDITAAAGYTSVDVYGLNSRGQVVGRSVTENPSHKEAALFWNITDGASVPNGFDLGYSGLNAIAASGKAAGFTDPGTYTIVRWDAAQPSATPIAITPPAGSSSPQVVGISRAGEVLLAVSDSGVQRPALWDGSTCAFIGPAPDVGETFWPTNCAISSSGDVAILYFTAGGAATLRYYKSTDRTTPITFTFPGPIDLSSSAYNLHISDAGLASFDTSIRAGNTVCVASAAQSEQRTFSGYTSFLNASGTLVFGSEGDFYYWDAAAWSDSPVKVPLNISTTSGGVDLKGFNDDGSVLAILTQQSTRSLAILTPWFASNQPTSITLGRVRRIFHLFTGQTIRLQIVKVRAGGNGYSGRIRYVTKGTFPAGLRIRPGDGMLAGRTRAAGSAFIRVAAEYWVNGAKKRTPFVQVKLIVQ
jgi:hypothetical protein